MLLSLSLSSSSSSSSPSVILLKLVFIFTVHVKSIQTQLARPWHDPRLRRYESNGNRDYSYGYVSAPQQNFASQYPSNYPYLNYQRTPNYPQRWQQQQQQQQAQLNYEQPYTQVPQYQHQYQPQQQQQRSTPELAKYRYEGNYIQRIPGPIPAPTHQQHDADLQTQPQRRLGELLPIAPASFANAVLHVKPTPNPDYEAREEYYRPRRYPDAKFNNRKDALATESIVHMNDTKEQEPKYATATQHPDRETRYFHDILMRFGGPDKRSFGHVEMHPERGLQSRYETQRGNHRYKGEVFWADKAGGYGSHQWDMAQGKLL